MDDQWPSPRTRGAGLTGPAERFTAARCRRRRRREDWLNGFYDSRAAAAGGAAAADYRFVYCGPAGTWTPLHADVLRSFR